MKIEIGKNVNSPESIVQVQVKNKTSNKSMSFTIHNSTMSEVFHRIVFLFEQLAMSPEGDIKVVHYKKSKEEQTNDKETINR